MYGLLTIIGVPSSCLSLVSTSSYPVTTDLRFCATVSDWIVATASGVALPDFSASYAASCLSVHSPLSAILQTCTNESSERKACPSVTLIPSHASMNSFFCASVIRPAATASVYILSNSDLYAELSFKSSTMAILYEPWAAAGSTSSPCHFAVTSTTVLGAWTNIARLWYSSEST